MEGTMTDQATPKTLTAYKAFGPGLECRGFKYEIGKTYEQSDDPVICKNGFHAVTLPMDAWNYYLPTSPLARVTMHGDVLTHNEDSKIASAEITIEASITLPDWIRTHVGAIVSLCRSAKGALSDSGHAAATGTRGHAAATGNRGHAAATGEKAIAAALGIDGTAKAGANGWIVLACWKFDKRRSRHNLHNVRAVQVGTEGVESGKTYRINENGQFVEAAASGDSP